MLKLLSLKLIKESKLLSIKIFLVKVTLKIGQEIHHRLIIDFVFKSNHWSYKIKDLKFFMKKNCC